MTEYLHKDTGLISEPVIVVDPNSTEQLREQNFDVSASREYAAAHYSETQTLQALRERAPPSHAHVRKSRSPCL